MRGRSCSHEGTASENAVESERKMERAMSAQLSWQTACELGFRGNLDEWERLMGAATKR